MKFSFHTYSLDFKLKFGTNQLYRQFNTFNSIEYHSLQHPSSDAETGGWSLLELIFVMSLVIFILSLGYGSFQTFLMRQERQLFLATLKNSFTFARSEAFFRNSTVTICGSHSQQKCHLDKDWSSGYIIFVNPHRDISPEDPQQILRVLPGIRYGKVQFNGTSPHLHMSSLGITMNIGTFFYCPKPPLNNLKEIDGLVLNRVFRSYFLKENPDKLDKVVGAECGV